MSIWSVLTSFLGGGSVKVGSITLTAAEGQQGLTGLEKAWPTIGKAISARLANLPADADAVEAILDVVANLKIPAISQDAAIAEAVVKLGVLIFTNNRSALPGAQLPPWAGGSSRRGSVG